MAMILIWETLVRWGNQVKKTHIKGTKVNKLTFIYHVKIIGKKKLNTFFRLNIDNHKTLFIILAIPAG